MSSPLTTLTIEPWDDRNLEMPLTKLLNINSLIKKKFEQKCLSVEDPPSV